MKKWMIIALLCLSGLAGAMGCGQKDAVGNGKEDGSTQQTEESRLEDGAGEAAEAGKETGKTETGAGEGEAAGTENTTGVTEEAIAETQKGPDLAGTQPGTAGVTFTDALGNSVTVEQPENTAALSESYADAWLLAGGQLAAVTDDAGSLLASSSLPKGLVSLGSVKTPSVEKMIEAEVDFVLLSAAIEGHARIRETLEAAGITAAYFEVEHFEDYREMMKILTAITGRDDLYQEHVAAVEEGIAAQIARAAAAKEASEKGWSAGEDRKSPTVLFLRAFSTGVRAKGSDSMTGRMLKDLGCVNIADSDDSLLEDLSLEAILAADPDFIFVTTMGESEEAALAQVEEQLLANPAWQGLTAVQEGHYCVLPQELFHKKPNSRWEESYRILADEIYGAE